MEKALPPEKLREKLPRFLQKCAEEFNDDSRYRDDARYLRVWIQLVSLPPNTPTHCNQTPPSPSSSRVTFRWEQILWKCHLTQFFML
jgi:hypothetical protein